MDIVICDTAGRLHTAYALMEELQACKQAIAKEVGGQPSETLLVLDGTTGTLTLGCWCGVGRPGRPSQMLLLLDNMVSICSRVMRLRESACI